MKDPTAPEIKPIEPKPVTINAEKSALLVLELSEWCADPEYMAAPLVPGVTRLLERARAAGTLTAFTLPQGFIGQPHGQVYSGFKKRPSEVLLVSGGGHDKFADGKLKSLLDLYDITTLVLTGCKANMAILYTASTAARDMYDIIIPVDGIAATTEYEKEYTLYQFRTYPGPHTKRFTFTNLDMISFQSGM